MINIAAVLCSSTGINNRCTRNVRFWKLRAEPLADRNDLSTVIISVAALNCQQRSWFRRCVFLLVEVWIDTILGRLLHLGNLFFLPIRCLHVLKLTFLELVGPRDRTCRPI